MNIVRDPASAFDAAFLARAPGCFVRPEAPDDQPFVTALFAAVSPLRGLLTPALLADQAAAADAHFRGAFPDAMRRLVGRNQAAVGRIVIDWTGEDHVVGVDIAVLPSAGGIGLAMLRAWLAVADGLARPCRLTVVRANPARTIYLRLGFREEAGDADSPMVSMARQTQSRGAIQSQ